MTELIILCAFAPLVFLPFPAFRRLTQVWGWSAVAIAALCHGYTLFLHSQEPLLWIPAGAFLSVFVINLVGQRYRRGLSTLAVLFVSQALLAKNLGYVIVLLALADTFLGAELFLSSKIAEKNRAVQSLYQSALSLLPATLGLMLRLDGNNLVACVAVTIALRLFSWPVSHWLVEISGNNKVFPTYIGIISSFALWHILDFSQPELWAAVLLFVGILFSLGSKYTEMYAAFSLGLYAVNPAWGVLFTALWPLLGHRGLTVYLVALLTAAAGAVLADGTLKVFNAEGAYALAGISALAVARVFVPVERVKTPWYLLLLDVVFSALWAGLLIFFTNPVIPSFEPPAMVFAGTFLVIFILGKILNSKRPKFFRALPGLSPQIFSKSVFTTDLMTERRGETTELQQTRVRVWFFGAIESEAYLALLFGLLGAILLWGAR